jgi:hypothetical protein
MADARGNQNWNSSNEMPQKPTMELPWNKHSAEDISFQTVKCL